MKILFLNRHLYEAPILTTLRKLGVAVLVCGDLNECELVFRLHSTSVSLFVGHDEDGVKMNEVLKTNARFAKTPVILTTSKWTDQQCIDHQGTPMGANAYLRMPVDDRDFIRVIDAILGTHLSHGKGFMPSDDLPGMPAEDATRLNFMGSNEIQLEDAASVYGKPSVAGKNDGQPGLMISLEAPNTDVGLEIALESGGTKEFQIEMNGENGSNAAEQVLAVPIEATNDVRFDDVPLSLMKNGDEPFIDDEGATRLAISPTFDEPATQVAMSITDEALTQVAMPIGEDAATRVAMAFGEEAATRVAMSIIDDDEEETRAAFSIGDDAATRVSLSQVQPSGREDLDADALAAMPYLSKGGYSNPLSYREPMDDAVVPGGAANAPDVDTLKKYLYLREQDVTALSAQLRQSREQVSQLEQQLRHEKAVTTEFAHLAQEQDYRIQGFDREKAVSLDESSKELENLKFEMKRRSEKIRVMEMQVKEATDATERLKDRVRGDIRKIRTREKELENRLEIMKKDSEALLGAREQKIIDLKRKLDLVEFNTDLLQDQLEKEKSITTALREKLAKAAQIVRVAGGLLSPEEEALLLQGTLPGKDRTSAA